MEKKRRPSVLTKLSRRILRGGRPRKPATAAAAAPPGSTGDAGHWRAPTSVTAAPPPAPGLTREDLARALREVGDELDTAWTASGAALSDPFATMLRRIAEKLEVKP